MGCTLLVPQVRRGIIRLPMEMLRITFSAAAVHRGVSIERKNMPMLLMTRAAAPATKIFFIPISSYNFPAKGLASYPCSTAQRLYGSLQTPLFTKSHPRTFFLKSADGVHHGHVPDPPCRAPHCQHCGEGHHRQYHGKAVPGICHSSPQREVIMDW